jgi:hypothetical protein
MPSLFFKLGLITAVLVGWVVYDRWDDWTEQASVVSDSIETKVKSSLTSEPPAPVTTTVYKWQDAKGRWHFGDAPPPDAKHVVAESYSNDTNVLPRLTAQDMAVLTKKNKPADATGGGVFGHYVNAVDQARGAQDATRAHAEQMQRVLNTPN